MPTSRYKVRVTKDYLVFCSGHFITYDGDHCERLHGHNYRTAVEVEGDLDANHYVVNFIALKDMTRSIIDELDHRMLLPKENKLIHVQDDGPNIRVTYGESVLELPARRVRPLADRQHHRRAAGRLHRRPLTTRNAQASMDNATGLAGRGRGELRSVGRVPVAG